MTPFEIALQKRKELDEEKKKIEESKNSSSYSKEPKENIEWTGITKDPKVFRIIGSPVEVRELPSDPKVVFWSKIINDSGKSWVNIFHPSDGNKVDEDWILNRLYESVTEAQWFNWKEGELRDPNKPRSNERGYFVEKHVGLPSYNRVTQNKKENSKQFGHFRPRKRVVLNVIDRMDYWCIENKHTKILTSNYSPFVIKDEQGESKTLFYNDVGISEQVYDLFYTQVLEFRSHWDLDLIIRKEDKQTFVQDGFEDKIKKEIKSLIKIDPLTSEEAVYATYDLDKLFKPSGYYKLMNNFSSLFKQVDLDLKTNFYEELTHFYENEKAEKDKEQAEENKSVHPVPEVPKTVSEKPVATEIPVPSTPTRRGAPAATNTETLESKIKSLGCWGKLSESDKKSMLDNCTSLDGEKFSFKAGVNVIPCSCDKRIAFPDDVWTCPIDGTSFEE
jgi:hypothetical protein